MLIYIPNPIGATFTITIRNSSNTIVYGPVSHGNESFDPGTSDPGKYIMEVDNDGAINYFCYTVAECVCPVLESVAVTLSFSTYTGVFTFSFADGFCPFILNVTSPFTSTNININSLSDLVDNLDGTYTRSVTIGGYPSITYSVTTNPVGGGGVECTSGSATFECTSPDFTVTPYIEGSLKYIRVVANTKACGGIAINYAEINDPSDTGSLS